MIRTQIQLPDALYREAKRIAAEQEISLAEVLRRGLEHMQRIYPPRPTMSRSASWSCSNFTSCSAIGPCCQRP